MPSRRLKPGWTRVAFGEMATNVTERVDCPAESGVDRYVGLEHLESDSLRIRRWGSPTDVFGTKLRFRRGDIVFGRRRAYQRKLAVAHFDGICSAHALVLRAQPRVVLPEFLPFFMQSEGFMERAQQISVGSLSPTINWKTLEREEFILPALPEQRRIAAALDGIARAADSARKVEAAADALLSSIYQELFGHPENPARPLREIAEVRMGRQRSPRHAKGNHILPYVRAANVKQDSLDLTSVLKMNFDPGEQQIYALRPGDILVTEGCGSLAGIGANAVWNGEVGGVVCLQNTVIRLRAKEISPSLLRHWARYAFGAGLFAKAAKGTTIFHIGQKRCEQMAVRLPPDGASRVQAEQGMAALKEAKRRAGERAESLQRTRAALFQQELGRTTA